MNAVAASLRADGSPEAREAVARMLGRMAARASHQPGIVEERAAVIGWAGAQPAFADSPERAMLAADIRLANRAELRAALGLDGDASDPCIALEAYLRWGLDFARRLAGDFTIFIVDRREERFVAVRDALGIRPLYYRPGAAGLRAASELRALIEPGDGLDEGYLAEALAGDIVDIESTPYAEVRRVPAANALVVDRAGTRLVRYWEPPRVEEKGSIADHAARVRAALDEAVRGCCEGETRVGIHLSGGLDSSSLLGCIMANRYAEAVPGAFLLPWPEADERQWIDAAAAHWSLSPVFVRPPVDPATSDLASIARHKDLPDGPNGSPLLAPLHHELRAAGASVVISGIGGDQWWSGEPEHMSDLLRRLDLVSLYRWKAAGDRMGDSAWTWDNFARFGLLPFVPAVVKRAVRSVVPAPLPPWVAPAFAARVNLGDRLRRRPDMRDAPSNTWRRMRCRLESGEEAFSNERLDRASVDDGVELRHPMYDRRVVEAAFATPDSARIANGRNRVVLREAMADRLSPATYERVSKAELSDLLVAATGAPDVAPHLATPMLIERGWVTPEGVKALIDRVAVRRELTGVLPFWRVIGVEAWLRSAFEGK